MRQFSEKQIEKYIDYVDENILPKEEFLGRCLNCGEFLNTLKLPEGPESEVTCLKDRDDFIQQYDDAVEWGEIKE